MSHWDDAAAELNQFNALYAQVERKPKDKAALKKCVASAANMMKLFAWAKRALVPSDYTPFMAAWREVAKLAKARSASDEELAEGVEAFMKAVQRALDTTAPGRFTYEGLTVINEEHVSDELARKVLSGVDFLKALFKKRGVDASVIKEAISRVDLVLHDDVGAANFDSSSRVLTISVPELAKHGAGRFIDTMAGETIVHEFGHYIHLNYIRGEAKAVWDAPWEGIVDLADPKNRDQRNDPSRQKKLDELGVPTEYGKTNEREDFAETFMLFMVAPEKLSPTATFRMQRALSVSGLYGKALLRLAAEDLLDIRVAARFKLA